MRIAFYPAQSGKPFNGDTFKTDSLGGSETAVVYIARELAKLGHEVIVFTRATPGIYDDVAYVRFEKAKNILRTLPLDVLVCSRDPLPLIWKHQASLTVLWLHDLPQAAMPEPGIYAFVSAWQAQTFIQNGLAKGEKSVVLHNGVDLDLYHDSVANIDWISGTGGRDLTHDSEINLAWTSNPERGLWLMGEILQKIRRIYPNTRLHVYGRNSVYGWGESYEGNFLPDDMTNVEMHQGLTKAGLAEVLSQMDLWVYPTWWPETYCIAAVEAQAAGLPVVASNFGALGTTVRGGLLVEGRASDEGHLETLAEAALSLLADKDTRSRLGEIGLEFAKTQSWTLQAQAWHTTLIEGLAHA
jgi:glycosyltransferase involved in cell wall biosynthesis